MYIRKYVGSHDIVDITLDTFVQTWPNTACGWSEPKAMSGQAFTKEYTTVATVNYTDFNKSNETFYVVFFGEKPAYKVETPNKAFFEDLKDRRMLSKYEATNSDKY